MAFRNGVARTLPFHDSEKTRFVRCNSATTVQWILVRLATAREQMDTVSNLFIFAFVICMRARALGHSELYWITCD